MPVMKQVAKVKYNRYSGEKIPDLAYLDEDGNRLHLSNLGEEVFYVNYWTADDQCLEKSIPEINEMNGKLSKYREGALLNVCIKSTEEQWRRVLAENEFRGKHLFLEDTECFDNYLTIPGAMDVGLVPPMIVNKERDIMGSGMGASSGEQVVTIYMMKQAEDGISAGNAAKRFIKVATRHHNGKDSKEVREFSEFVGEFDDEVQKGG
ncbi:TlpA family protein disulfide reductase [Membranihabitans maritimus]|uniref:TlpA family protein disulfide reductase n=1 Tax=Membranihabitans maritimus TaxID=2904244 RepID=UPI001F3939B9|nr:hypothetical protein [Membranihabitans maritimus]